MKYYTIYLPTKPYLKKYFETLYCTPGQMFVIDQSTDFGDLIITKLASTLHSNLKPVDAEGRLYRLTDKLALKLPINWFRKLPNKELDQHQVIRINRTLENIFERDFCDIVQRAHDFLGIDRQTAIESFAKNHNIHLEIDITFEALKKVEYRFRKKNFSYTVRKKIVQEMAPMLLAA